MAHIPCLSFKLSVKAVSSYSNPLADPFIIFIVCILLLVFFFSFILLLTKLNLVQIPWLEHDTMGRNPTSATTSQKLHSLNILSFNVEGLDSMLSDPGFTQLIQRHDICILSETMRMSDSKLNLENFWDDSQVRPKHEKKGRPSGGVTVLVKTPLRSGIKVVYKSEGLVWIQLDKYFFDFDEDLYICAVYIAPQSSDNVVAKRTDYFNDLLVTTNRYMDLGNVLLAGDFNSRVGNDIIEDDIELPFLSHMLPDPTPLSNLPQRTSCDQVINQHGKKLTQLCNSLNLKIANGRCPGDILGNFTCFANKGASTVDYFIGDSKILRKISLLKVLPPEFSSVHSPISMKLDCKSVIKETIDDVIPSPQKVIWDPEKVEIYCARLKRPEKLQELESLNRELLRNDLTQEQTNELIKKFNSILVLEAKACMKSAKIPSKKGVSLRTKSRFKPKGFKWYSKECSNLKRRLQNLAKLLQRCPRDPYIRGQYCLAKKEYRKTVKKAKQSYEEDAIKILESKTSNPKDFWSYLKSLGRKPQNQDPMPGPEEWVDHFSSLYAGNHLVNASADERVANIVKSVDQQLQDGPNVANEADDQIMALFEIDEVMKGLRRLKKGKAVASDLISNDMLKATADIIAPTLVNMFNRIIISEFPPETWDLGIIIPLFKSGVANDVNNYRGITINSCLSKLFMMLMNDRLQVRCDEKNLIYYNQIGFRKGFRPADHVFTLKTLIDQAFSKKKQLFTCFVDFKKAYDTVWRDGLFLKLLENGINKKFVRLLRNIYTSSSLCIKLPNGMSTEFPSQIGLKQGCNLSPLLFNLFVNDFLAEINMPLQHSPYLGDIPVNGLFYADDLVLMSESKEGLQALLDKLHTFTESWFLQVNKSKTKCIVFSSQRKRPVHVVNFGGSPLITTENYCYLGTSFTRNGSLNEAGHVLHDKSIKALNGLLQRIYKFKSCDPKVMLELFDKMILPIALYNSEIWGTMCFPVNESNTNLLGATPQKNPIEDIQIKFCKRVLGVNDKSTNWAVTSELGRYPTIITVMERMIKYWHHAAHSPSPIVNAALKVSRNLDSSGKRVWFTYLRRIMESLGMNHILYTCDELEIFSQINKTKSMLRSKAYDEWKEHLADLRVSETSKLKLYSSLKEDFGYAEYLSTISDSKAKRALCKFRISSHNLPVEVNRYIKIERVNRLCPFCSSDTSDEQHYLCECIDPLFSTHRDAIFAYFSDKIPSFANLTPETKTTVLLGSSDPPVISKIATFCNKIVEIFKEFNTRT